MMAFCTTLGHLRYGLARLRAHPSARPAERSYMGVASPHIKSGAAVRQDPTLGFQKTWLSAVLRAPVLRSLAVSRNP